MSTLARTRGRLPARVYWVRRAAVLVTAMMLVFAFARLLGGSGGDGSGPAAGPVAATSTAPSAAPATTQPITPIGPVGVITEAPAGRPTGTPAPQALAQPDGPCDVADITATPTIKVATAGAPVRIGLELTGIKPACTFTVNSETLAVRITRKDKRVWTSQHCPLSITTRSLVVRSAVPIPVNVRWSGRHSDADCSKSAGWAMPGNYTVTAAVIGSTPTDKRFALMSPPRPIVTKTITPKPKPKPTQSATTKPTATAG